ncbi:complex I intermediate-associated protein 30 [Apiospora marii]|uniref:complex I intermediate-associated protein 30 n=1 Tax=Apiospora marii TaxID=335849 RepID=UPI00313048FE
MALQQLPLLGGTLYAARLMFRHRLWAAVDDSVLGGNSSSHLDMAVAKNEAAFSGYLDDITLGGAGFASQQTVGSLDWDLTGYDGLLVSVALSDGKLYTLNLKDILPTSDRESTLLYETSFTVPGSTVGSSGIQNGFLPWANFAATYRGRTQPDAKPLNTSTIKTISLMMRSTNSELWLLREKGSNAVSLSKVNVHQHNEMR